MNAPIPDWAYEAASILRPSSSDSVNEIAQHIANAHQRATQTLTCVYCGQEYPPGTPAHGSSVLTDHIRVCEKHPMRALEEELATLRVNDPYRRGLCEDFEGLLPPHKHPGSTGGWLDRLKAMKEDAVKVRAALAGLVGATEKAELEQMEATIRLMPAPAADKVAILDAIHVLIETAPLSP